METQKLDIQKTLISADGLTLAFYATEENTGLDHIFDEMFNFDVYNLKKQHFDKGDVIIDIGANLGLFSIYLAKKYPDVTILAYEASAITHGLLLKNIQENNVHNIKPFHVAVHKNSGSPITINYVKKSPGSSGEYIKGGIPEKATSISLDDIIEKNHLNNIAFLKIDCEGSEYDILYNSKKLSGSLIKNLAVEIHKVPGQNEQQFIAYVSKKMKPVKVNYLFQPEYILKNKRLLAHKIAGQIGIVIKKIHPGTYKKLKSAKDRRFTSKWRRI